MTNPWSSVVIASDIRTDRISQATSIWLTRGEALLNPELCTKAKPQEVLGVVQTTAPTCT